MPKNDLQGALELLILKTLSDTERLHGYGIALHIQMASDSLLQVEEGALYPALRRMQQKGLLRAKWDFTQTKRLAKFYSITSSGHKQLRKAQEDFEQLVNGVRAVLQYA